MRHWKFMKRRNKRPGTLNSCWLQMKMMWHLPRVCERRRRMLDSWLKDYLMDVLERRICETWLRKSEKCFCCSTLWEWKRMKSPNWKKSLKWGRLEHVLILYDVVGRRTKAFGRWESIGRRCCQVWCIFEGKWQEFSRSHQKVGILVICCA